MPMSPRERVLAALRHREPDRVPKEAGFTPHLYETFKQQTGSTDPAAYFGMEMRHVGFRGTKVQTDFTVFYPEPLPAGTSITEYGTAHVPGDFYHFTKMRFPMAGFTSARQVADYPWPDFGADYRHEHLEGEIAGLHDQGWFVIGSVGHIFENSWQLRGMERLFLDFTDDPELATAILDRMTADRALQARRYAEAGADMVLLGDDVGMQDRLMMSPATWRRWFRPRLAAVVAAARGVRPDIHVFYHSDGSIESIIPDLIEVGIDVLNPVQPECMDPVALKKQYGDRLAFWGTIGTQTTMPHGTPDEVRATVRERVATVGQGGGLVLAPTHVLEPDVPWENVLAFFEAAEKGGQG